MTEIGSDDDIANTLDLLTHHAQLLGFAQEGTRADHEIALTSGDARIRYEPRFIHGEGRVVLTITKGNRGTTTKTIRVTGMDQLAKAKTELVRIVRNATAVRA